MAVKATPLESRGVCRLGPRQWAISADPNIFGFDHWAVNLGVNPPTCDCPAFDSNRDLPATCKHISYLELVEKNIGV